MKIISFYCDGCDTTFRKIFVAEPPPASVCFACGREAPLERLKDPNGYLSLVSSAESETAVASALDAHSAESQDGDP